MDETEVLKVKRLSKEEIETLIHAGKFQQAVHVMAWLLAKEAEHNSERITGNEAI